MYLRGVWGFQRTPLFSAQLRVSAQHPSTQVGRKELARVFGSRALQPCRLQDWEGQRRGRRSIKCDVWMLPFYSWPLVSYLIVHTRTPTLMKEPLCVWVMCCWRKDFIPTNLLHQTLVFKEGVESFQTGITVLWWAPPKETTQHTTQKEKKNLTQFAPILTILIPGGTM